ncbi:MAG: pilus assembly protein [Clostridiales bacterium]|nr:pilus assembly protein [Clostridiales bacterium]
MMPFLQSQNSNKNNSTANSLRTCLNVLHRTGLIKRASSFTSRKYKASMTVEAAFALPLFIFLIVNLIYVMNIIGAQSRLSAALHQVGNKIAFYGYAYEKSIGNVLPNEIEGIASMAVSWLYVRGEIEDYVGAEYLNKSCIKSGAGGIRYDGTVIAENNDIVEICLNYQVQPLIAILGFENFNMCQRYYARMWTGYDVEMGISDFTSDEPMVYVTETGTVYHTNRNCTHLNLSVTSVEMENITDKRNQSGGKYYPCEMCGAYPQETVYITAQGSSYHTKLNCSGLKRTIYTIPLSQVGGRGRCARCR